MQVTGQNIQQQKMPQVQYNCNYNCGNNAVTTPQQPVQAPVMTQAQYAYPQNYYIPQQIPQAQNLQVPASTSGVNIQIFNPSVTPAGAQSPTYNVNAPCYPSNYYTNPIGCPQQPETSVQGIDSTEKATTVETSETKEKEEKKTEKKKIVQLTDDYIKNLENYLNSQEAEIRLTAAKEVYARLEEDSSRKDDKALNALINKMLQDPSQEIRILALSALQGRIVTGDDYTVGVLTRMQQDKEHYGMDAIDASRILLQMSGQQIEKDVPVSEKKEKETKTEKSNK
ncbi:HEAT repeat domain-containing protein [bacterium]|nr:HEAT repeat domain-containing protein [bacterium]